MTRKKIGIIVAVALALVFAVAISINGSVQKAKTARIEAMSAEINPLLNDKYALERELKSIESQYQSKAEGAATVQFLFTNPAERIYSDVVPRMRAHDMLPFLAVSKQAFPGMPGYMSVPQCQELQSAGWKICVAWDGDTKLSSYLDEMKEKLAKANLRIDSEDAAVYFPEDTWKESYDQVLLDSGYRFAIHHGEAGKIVTTGIETGAADGGVWHPGAYVWQGSGGSDILEQAVKSKGNLIFAIDWLGADIQFRQSQMDSMLNAVSAHQQNDAVKLIGFSETIEYRKELKAGQSSLLQDFEPRKRELEEKIAAKEKEISAVYEKYKKK